MTTIPVDVADTDTGALSMDGAADAFLAQFGENDDASKKKPSEEQNDETEEVSNDETPADDNAVEDDTSDENPEDAEDTDEDDGSEEDDKAKDKKYAESDDIYVKVKVGEDEHEVPVKDLKRLYGQEAALTRKSQEVAEQRKVADAKAASHVAALDVMLKRAQEKAAPYANIDWMGLAKNPDISAEEASALRGEAQRAFEDVQFLQNELGGFMQAIEVEQQKAFTVRAQECVKALTSPGTEDKPNPVYIEGWNDKTYDELRAFAIDLGADKADINKLVDPIAFKILHMAMQYKRGASKVLTQKVNKTPKKIVKTSSTEAVTRKAATPGKTKAMEKLQRDGSVESAADAFLAGFSDD